MPHYYHIVEVSSAGKIFVVGDLHGAIVPFQSVLDKLTPDDTLIITGDTIDRGLNEDFRPGSPQVLDLILQYQQAAEGTKAKIYSIRGNHEESFLAVINLFHRMKDEPPPRQYSVKDLQQFVFFIKDGGDWIFNTDTDARQARVNFFQTFRHASTMKEFIPALKKILTEMVNAPDPMTELIPNIMAYQQWIHDLPYVIKINGERSMLVAHADLHLSDQEIDRKLAEEEEFSLQDIAHLVDARVRDFAQPGQRNSESRPVLVGHNIIDMPGPDVADPVRRSTNHINLDAGAYFTNGFLLMNVTDNQVAIVGRNISSENLTLLQYGKNTIQEHLEHNILQQEQEQEQEFEYELEEEEVENETQQKRRRVL